jgi:hypothetical protein
MRPDATRDKPVNMTWDKYWRSRWQWSASGSIHSQYIDDEPYIEKERYLRNKFISLIEMPNCNMDRFLNRPAELHAWSSTKYEWGKQRAIYGTDLTSYVLAHFAFYNCEDLLPNEFPVGRKATEAYVRSKVSSILEGVSPLCIDFEDFNSQHSVDAMQAVIDAYVTVYGSQLSREQLKAVEWTKQSISRMIIHDLMGLGETYQANGTLLSGWRLTTFLNSVLNAIYTTVMHRDAGGVRRSVHNGDDVLLGVKNWGVLQSMLKKARKYNIRLQQSKCAYGAIAEFLRVDHCSPGSGQYLTRNIATLVHGRIESTMAVNISDVVESMEARFSEHVARGGKQLYVARLREVYLARMGEIYHTDPDVLHRLRDAHRVVGGLSERTDATIDKTYTLETITMGEEITKPLHGVGDFASVLVAELELDDKEAEVSAGLYNATLRAVKMNRSRLFEEKTEDIHRAAVFRGISHSYKDLLKKTPIGKAQLTGFVTDIIGSHRTLDKIKRYLSGSRDPLGVLKIIS